MFRRILKLYIRIFRSEENTVGARMTREDYRVAISGEGGAAPAPPLPENTRIAKAYERACANRDFEIKLFWQRSLFFWGFVSACFVGYFQISNSKGEYPQELKFYCILLGLLFSVAWLLIIKASKHWQDNWEAHIDALEEYVTGPLFQIVRYPTPEDDSIPKWSVRSVSRITEVMAYVVIVAWTGLLLHYVLPKVISLVQLKSWIKTCWISISWNHMPEIIAFVAFALFLRILFRGYPRKRKIVASDERRGENFPNFHRTLPNRSE